MGIDDLVNQGKEFLDQNKDKIGEALNERAGRAGQRQRARCRQPSS